MRVYFLAWDMKKQNENSLENVTCIGKNKTCSWRDLLRKNFWKDVRKSIASCCVLLIMVYSLHFLVGELTLRPIWSLQTRTLQLRLANCKLWAMQLQNTCSEQRTKFDPRGSSTTRKIPTQSSIGQLGLMLAGITCPIAFIFFQIIESEVLEILMVFSNDEDPEMSMVRACAERALEIAEGLSLIKQNKESSWR